MGKVFEVIDERLQAFIKQQQMFFVATAPNAANGHVNVSPKGMDSFRVLDGTTVAYADLVGSGIETVAHLRENGRIVVMFCAFNGAPNIVRLHGRGEVVEPGQGGFEDLASHFPVSVGLRSVIRIECTRISDSCGYGVPLFDFVGPREQLTKWAENKGADGVKAYLQQKNLTSIDGLPGVSAGGFE